MEMMQSVFLFHVSYMLCAYLIVVASGMFIAAFCGSSLEYVLCFLKIEIRRDLN